MTDINKLSEETLNRCVANMMGECFREWQNEELSQNFCQDPVAFFRTWDWQRKNTWLVVRIVECGEGVQVKMTENKGDGVKHHIGFDGESLNLAFCRALVPYGLAVGLLTENDIKEGE